MDRHAAELRRRDAGRRGHGDRRTLASQIANEARRDIAFAASRLACQKRARAGFQDLESFVLFHEMPLPPLLRRNNRRTKKPPNKSSAKSAPRIRPVMDPSYVPPRRHRA